MERTWMMFNQVNGNEIMIALDKIYGFVPINDQTRILIDVQDKANQSIIVPGTVEEVIGQIGEALRQNQQEKMRQMAQQQSGLITPQGPTLLVPR